RRAGSTADEDAYVRIIVTRGTGTAPNIDLAYAPGPATTVLMVRPLPKVAGNPSRLAMIPRLRNDRRALDPAIKSGNYLNNVLGLAEAKAKGATDCLFLNADGNVTEASTANFYVVIDEVIYTPPLGAGLLPGITRRMLEECAHGAGIAFRERNFSEDEIEHATEMFLTSTGRDISPVTHVNDRELNGGRTAPFTSKMMERFTAYCDAHALEVDAARLREFGIDV
ncbi:MAG: aminotransferase class IV family protein, partial [Planctomycetes bacterium]|nr:aminotransferase class IV family protein [Planctomycetota bacterium]